MNIDVNIQSSIRIQKDMVIYFDPLERKEKHDADYIFITHPHFDHFSLLSILELKKENTVIITPKDIVEELLSIGINEEYIMVVKPHGQYVLKNMEFSCIPAYNLHKKYHPKSASWVGYLLNIDDVTYYISGDTDALKEIKDIHCDVAFLCVGGNYTMDCLEASALCNIIHPKLAIPTHYGYNSGSYADAQIFKKHLDKDIRCQIFMKR